MFSIDELTPDQWRLFRQVRLAALAEAPDAFGSRVADWQGDGDVEARWRHRLESVELNLIGRQDGQPVGMASGFLVRPDSVEYQAINDHVGGQPQDWVELISMWVAPQARGTGLAAALIQRVVEWADEHGRRTALVVRTANSQARMAYRSAGFLDLGALVSADSNAPSETLMVTLPR